ncbi:hypothetical protein E2C01_052924 [Portunus trituberculatus]|uniref:Uncharacterized protein n=1 Tax=Portunus trituberculatus TaxID=210409 RepID=A0A5B7GMZ9_PORTR|nr:hypothetical protein [Portunus trituberculatus]
MRSLADEVTTTAASCLPPVLRRSCRELFFPQHEVLPHGTMPAQARGTVWTKMRVVLRKLFYFNTPPDRQPPYTTWYVTYFADIISRHHLTLLDPYDLRNLQKDCAFDVEGYGNGINCGIEFLATCDNVVCLS